MVSKARQVILHADDFGMSPWVSKGILDAFYDGLLTSTSLMANAPDATKAMLRWQNLERRRRSGDIASLPQRRRLGDPEQAFDLGIHLNLTQGRPLTASQYPGELLDANGHFPGVFSLFRQLWHRGERFADAIHDELSAQIGFMLDRGHRPTHINGHQYVELIPAIAPVIESLLNEFHIPVLRVARERTWLQSVVWPGIGLTAWANGGLKAFFARRFHNRMRATQTIVANTFFGTMTAGTTQLATINSFLKSGVFFRIAEIGLHPGQIPEADNTISDGWDDPLAHLRPRELQWLTSSDLAECLAMHEVTLGRLARSDATQAREAA